MENEETQKKKKDYLLPLSVLTSLLIIAIAWVYMNGKHAAGNSATPVLNNNSDAGLEESVLPEEGAVLPLKWNDLGKQMADAGVIDAQKFEAIYSQRGGLDEESKKLLYGENNGNLKITPENSGVVLNLLWALGLGNKNDVLDKGEMADPKYGGAGDPPAGGFASTGGWTLAEGDAMEHYSRHQFIALNPEQQALVESVSKNIYRPCCNNSTHFPDCNHGMAMLGLLELMASQGVSEEEIYKTALLVNSYWFPDTYLTIAKYFEQKNIRWSEVNPKEALGVNFSSANGYRAILTKIAPPERKSGGGCGV